MPLKPPSAVCKEFPWGSVKQNCEDEVIACNIVKMLARTGDTWRQITEEEYAAERQKDMAKSKNPNGIVHFSEIEIAHFREVLPYTVSAEAAASFCPAWKKALGNPS
jgi:hypothetical protein